MSEATKSTGEAMRAIYEGSVLPIVMLDATGAFVRANPAWCALVGFDESNLVGKRLLDLLPVEERSAGEEAVRELTGGDAVAGREFQVQTRHGRLIEVLATATPVEGSMRGVVHCLTFQDVTARRYAESELRESETRYRHLVERSPEAIFVLQDRRIVYANGAAAALLGEPNERALLGRSGVSLVHPDDRDELRAVARTLTQQTARGQRVELRCRTLRGDWMHVEGSAVLTTFAGARALQYVMRDISARKRLEAIEADRRRIYELVMYNESLERTMGEVVHMIEQQLVGVRAGVVRTDLAALRILAHGGVPKFWQDAVSMSRQSADPFGVWTSFELSNVLARTVKLADEEGEAESSVWTVPLSPAVGAERGALLIFTQPGRKPTSDELEILKATGRLADVALTHRGLVDQLTFQARHDVLTGLPNRQMFDELVRHALAQARLGAEQVGLLFFDLDRFKVVNDTLGHAAGDAVLTQVAERLRKVVGEGDTLCRMGADEFSIIVRRMSSAEQLIELAKALQATLALPFRVRDTELFLSGTVGISVFPQDGTDAETLHKNANAALHEAKERGASGYEVFSPELSAAARRRMTLESELRRAIDRNELLLYYQPQLDLATNCIVGVEALLRWNHAELGMVSPVEFIPVAEEAGLIVPIGAWVLEEACRQIRAWRAAGIEPVPVAVNVSALQFARNDFIDSVAEALRSTAVEPELVEIELTESTIMTDVRDSSAQIARLRALGLRVSVDDFGTGYSSLAYLQQLPIDSLKIDRSFIKDVREPEDASKHARALVQTIVALGKNLGVKVVAEGIETEHQASFLRTIGCERGQGFLFSKPRPPLELRFR